MFRNVRVLPITVPGVTVARLLLMEVAYSRGVGVSCDHCPVVGRWDADDKPAKATARDMNRLTTRLDTSCSPPSPACRTAIRRSPAPRATAAR